MTIVSQSNLVEMRREGEWLIWTRSSNGGPVETWREPAGATPSCRVYWGSHGCMLKRGHDGEHLCSCTFLDGEMLPHVDDEPEFGNVGRAPYYGEITRFYGEDAVALGLPGTSDDE